MENGKNGNEKVAVKYVRKYCLYECSKQSDYNKHLTTLKHARNQQNFQNGNKPASRYLHVNVEMNIKVVMDYENTKRVLETKIENRRKMETKTREYLFAYVVRSIRMYPAYGNTIKMYWKKWNNPFQYNYHVNVEKHSIIMTHIFYT